MESKENAIRKSAGRGHGITTGGLFTHSQVLTPYREAKAKKVEEEASKEAREAERAKKRAEKAVEQAKSQQRLEGGGEQGGDETAPAAVT